MVIRTAAVLTAFMLGGAAAAQSIHTYIGQITPTSILIAWGTTQGRGVNTIGRDSHALGAVQVRIDDRTLPVGDRNWVDVTGLRPDTSYRYEVDLNGTRIGGSIVRTWPARATRLTFFVIGDYGDGSAGQRGVAAAMAAEFQRREQAGDPVRFVLTAGDNIYASANLGYVIRGSGSDDQDWESKYFEPYQPLLDRIPFMPTPGNHDGNTSESAADLNAYLDNFFFPGNRPARWYQFDFGGLADFFALDSTDNSRPDIPPRHMRPRGSSRSGWRRRWRRRARPGRSRTSTIRRSMPGRDTARATQSCGTGSTCSGRAASAPCSRGTSITTNSAS